MNLSWEAFDPDKSGLCVVKLKDDILDEPMICLGYIDKWGVRVFERIKGGMTRFVPSEHFAVKYILAVCYLRIPED